MIEDWRALLYPMGFLSHIAFSARFIVQWLGSERRGQSVVTRPFWQISLVGNILLYVHSLVQMQFHVCLVQGFNGVLSWRNLELMQPEGPRRDYRIVLWLLGLSAAVTFGAFFVQDWLGESSLSWFRVPTFFQTSVQSVDAGWHVAGFLGLLLFNSRFWVQWWSSERMGQSVLGVAFWWLSLVGALLSAIYFFHIRDFVNLSGFVVGMVPYVRNLMLLTKRGEQTA